MISFFRDLFNYLMLPRSDSSKAKLTGTGLFCNDYVEQVNYDVIRCLFEKYRASPIIRIPIPPDTAQQAAFNNSMVMAQKARLTSLVLFDTYQSYSSVEQRVKMLKSKHPQTVYFELFNELPLMSYPGEQFTSLDDLIKKTNTVAALIRFHFPRAQILSMAPVNLLGPSTFSNEWGKDPITQLTRLANETKTDIISVHMYMDSWRQKSKFMGVADILNELHNKTYKPIWLTEIGVSNWKKHTDIFDDWTSRITEYIPSISEILWYRQAIDLKTLVDGGFALHEVMTGAVSPLFSKLTEGK